MKKEFVEAEEGMKLASKLTAPPPKEEAEVARRRVGCELCSEGAAAVHCESDGARLCWTCDARVHEANFLVARHARVLLCRHCRGPTPWRASGSRLALTVSLCLRCSTQSALPQLLADPPPKDLQEEESTDETKEFKSKDDDDSDELSEEKEEGEEEEGENQVVPWTLPAAAFSAESFSSSSDGGSSSDRQPISNRRSLKRMKKIGEFRGQKDDHRTSSSSERTSSDEATSFAGGLCR